jgi:hypothetical protein
MISNDPEEKIASLISELSEQAARQRKSDSEREASELAGQLNAFSECQRLRTVILCKDADINRMRAQILRQRDMINELSLKLEEYQSSEEDYKETDE